MALDTAKKRYSAAGIQVTLIAGVFPEASMDGFWRQASGWGYAGNVISAVAAHPDYIVTIARRKGRR